MDMILGVVLDMVVESWSDFVGFFVSTVQSGEVEKEWLEVLRVAAFTGVSSGGGGEWTGWDDAQRDAKH